MEDYKTFVIDLYKQNRSISYISDALYKKVNTRLKSRNKKSGGEWWVFVPDIKYKKTECIGFVYQTVYSYIKYDKYKQIDLQSHAALAFE